MPITYNLQPNPQWQFTDLIGVLAADGTIETFRAVDHTQNKAIYKDDQGVEAWPNPLDLNAAGASGAFFWADDEPYYVVIKDKDGVTIFEQDNYPHSSGAAGLSSDVDPNFNYITNGQFAEFIQQNYTSPLPMTIVNLAYGGWGFSKSNTTATDTLSFVPFSPGQTEVPQTPIYYLNYNCTGPGTGETANQVYFTLPKVQTFNGEEVNFQFYGKSTFNSSVEISITQYFGSGGSPSPFVQTNISTTTLTANWEQYTATFAVPSILGKTLGTDGTDYLAIVIGLPLNFIADVSITNVKLAQGSTITEFQSVSQQQNISEILGSVIPLPAPANIYNFIMVGQNGTYELANQAGEIIEVVHNKPVVYALDCDGSSYFSSDYPQLFAAIENDFGFGVDAFINSSNSSIAEFTPYQTGVVTVTMDFNTGFTFTPIAPGNTNLIQGLGGNPVTVGTSSGIFIALTYNTGSPLVNTGAGTSPFTVTIPTPASAFTIQVVIVVFTAGATITGGQYWQLAVPTVDYYIWYRVDGVGVDPAVPSSTGLMVAILSTDTAQDVAQKTLVATSGTAISDITFAAASTLSGGDYFLMNSPSIGYYVWYQVDGVGTDPKPASRTAIPVSLLSTDAAADVMTKTVTAVRSVQFRVPRHNGLFLRTWDNGAGVDPNAATRYPSNPGCLAGDIIGTLQLDELESHTHTSDFPTTGVGQTPVVDGTSGLTQRTTTATGGFETRPVNAYVRSMIRIG